MGTLLHASRRPVFLVSGAVRRLSYFKSDDLQVRETTVQAPKPDNSNLKFGHHTSDHMLEIDWTMEKGWAAPVIRPVEPFKIHPAAKALHYAVELFEGMKAYRCTDGQVRMFRPMENMERMSRSAERAALPAFDKGELLKCIKKLIGVEQEWVPYSDSCSLYIRPTLIGTEPTLGVSITTEAKLFVICGPVGPYFPTGLKPVKLLADPSYARAWPGGCGSTKMGSNYAPTIAIQNLAVQQGCQQVLWLFGEQELLTEVGTMNLFVFWTNEQGETELITPTLDTGLILPGVTRKSLIELAHEWNEFKVTEGTITMDMFVKALNEGRIKEVFGAGTACVVCPVQSVLYKGEELVVGAADATGPLTSRFYSYITDIHYGKIPHRWMESIEENEETVRNIGAQ